MAHGFKVFILERQREGESGEGETDHGHMERGGKGMGKGGARGQERSKSSFFLLKSHGGHCHWLKVYCWCHQHRGVGVPLGF